MQIVNMFVRKWATVILFFSAVINMCQVSLHAVSKCLTKFWPSLVMRGQGDNTLIDVLNYVKNAATNRRYTVIYVKFQSWNWGVRYHSPAPPPASQIVEECFLQCITYQCNLELFSNLSCRSKYLKCFLLIFSTDLLNDWSVVFMISMIKYILKVKNCNVQIRC